MSNEKVKLTPGKIAYKYFPETSFDECMMSCMSCDEDKCEMQELAIKGLSIDIAAYADQEHASLKERVRELEEGIETARILISEHAETTAGVLLDELLTNNQQNDE